MAYISCSLYLYFTYPPADKVYIAVGKPLHAHTLYCQQPQPLFGCKFFPKQPHQPGYKAGQGLYIRTIYFISISNTSIKQMPVCKHEITDFYRLTDTSCFMQFGQHLKVHLEQVQALRGSERPHGTVAPLTVKIPSFTRHIDSAYTVGHIYKAPCILSQLHTLRQAYICKNFTSENLIPQ